MLKLVFALVLMAAIVHTYPAPTDGYGSGGGGGYGGGGGGYGGPQQYGYQPQNDYYEDRDYRFNYYVNDDYTYNYQTRQENKYGNTVTGSYSLVEPNGLLRVVDYIADGYGFRANVKHQPHYGGGGGGGGKGY